MGFIDWHGTKQNHYDDVVEFAKTNEQMEKEHFDRLKRKKADAEFFGVPELEKMPTEEILRLIAYEKKKLDNMYQKSIDKLDVEMKERATQFYKDFWLFHICNLLKDGGFEGKQIMKISQVLLQGILKLENITSISVHLNKESNDSTYGKYLEASFAHEKATCRFWSWIGYLEKEHYGSEDLFLEFKAIYVKLISQLAFYLNQIKGQERFATYIIRQKKEINSNMITSYRRRFNYDSEIEKLVNPLYAVDMKEVRDVKTLWDEDIEVNEKNKFIVYLKYTVVLVGSCSRNKKIEDVEKEKMIAEQLYLDFKDEKLKKESIAGILPEEATNSIRQKKLPVIQIAQARIELNENEEVHYLENAITYFKKNEISDFKPLHGSIYVTDKRIVVKAGNKVFEIAHEELEKVCFYDAMPEILEFVGNGHILLVQTANTEETYQFFRMIMKQYEEPAKEPLNMETLSWDFFVKEDMDAYLFELKSLNDSDLSDELHAEFTEMIELLEKLDYTLKQYPSHTQQAHRFFTYYIPEIIRLTYAYIEYIRAGVSSDKMSQVYAKVLESVRKLKSASAQKINEIYQMSTMNTVANANALHRIMGQDGFADGDTVLKH